MGYRRQGGLELCKIQFSPIQKAEISAIAHNLGRKPEVKNSHHIAASQRHKNHGL
jgi:hypothetical protein